MCRFVALQYRNRCDIRLRTFRKMYLQKPVLQFRLGTLVVDRDLDGNFSSEMAVGAFDAEVFFTAGRALALESGNNQNAFVPGDLHIGPVDARHFDQDNDLVGAFADVYVRHPGRTLMWLRLKFEVHTYSRLFNSSLSSLINS